MYIKHKVIGLLIFIFYRTCLVNTHVYYTMIIFNLFIDWGEISLGFNNLSGCINRFGKSSKLPVVSRTSFVVRVTVLF